MIEVDSEKTPCIWSVECVKCEMKKREMQKRLPRSFETASFPLNPPHLLTNFNLFPGIQFGFLFLGKSDLQDTVLIIGPDLFQINCLGQGK